MKLSKNGQCVLYLTEKTIDKIEFVASNTDKGLPLRRTKDIDMVVKVDAANLDEMYGKDTDKIDEEALPREIDSVRDLFHYATAPHDRDFCYLEGIVEITDGFTKSVSTYTFMKLFVMNFEETYSIRGRDTKIHILLRESA
jgi:hypothetical protein